MPTGGRKGRHAGTGQWVVCFLLSNKYLLGKCHSCWLSIRWQSAISPKHDMAPTHIQILTKLLPNDITVKVPQQISLLVVAPPSWTISKPFFVVLLAFQLWLESVVCVFHAVETNPTQLTNNSTATPCDWPNLAMSTDKLGGGCFCWGVQRAS